MVNASFSLYTFEYFLMILVRISCFIFVAPFFGISGVPSRPKFGFAVFISLILYHILPAQALDYSDVFGYAVIVVKEGITGLLIGFMANVCNSIVLFAGTIIDQNMGLSMATEYDPMTQTQAPITGTLYNYLVLLLLLASNLDQYLIRAIVDSYELIPISGQVFQTDSMLATFTTYLVDFFVLGFRIALPVFACIMIFNSVLGIMAKVAPQMNMFAIGMQLKILFGLLILFLTVQLLPYVSDFVFTEIKKMTVSIIQAMY